MVPFFPASPSHSSRPFLEYFWPVLVPSCAEVCQDSAEQDDDASGQSLHAELESERIARRTAEAEATKAKAEAALLEEEAKAKDGHNAELLRLLSSKKCRKGRKRSGLQGRTCRFNIHTRHDTKVTQLTPTCVRGGQGVGEKLAPPSAPARPCPGSRRLAPPAVGAAFVRGLLLVPPPSAPWPEQMSFRAVRARDRT